MTDLKTLRALAEAATKDGEWTYEESKYKDNVRNMRYFLFKIHGKNKSNFLYSQDFPSEWWSDFKYIAAANPQTILALLDAHEKMREALEFYADKSNWTSDEDIPIGDCLPMEIDCYGSCARQALREVGE